MNKKAINAIADEVYADAKQQAEDQGKEIKATEKESRSLIAGVFAKIGGKLESKEFTASQVLGYIEAAGQN